MKKIALKLLLLILLSSITSCTIEEGIIKNEEDSQSTINEMKLTMNVNEVYNIGFKNKKRSKQSNITWSSDNEKVATVDKNGIITAHNEGKAFITIQSDKIKEIYEVFVKSGVFILGENHLQKPIYWENGVLHTLTIPSNWSNHSAKSICTIDKDIYIGGQAVNSYESFKSAVIWKNGILYKDNDGAGIDGTYLTDMHVSDNNKLYVSLTSGHGYDAYSFSWEPYLSTNNSFHLWGFTTHSLFVKGNDIYTVSKSQNFGAKVFKNQADLYGPLNRKAQQYELHDNTSLNSIFVDNNDNVHVVGSWPDLFNNYPNVSVYWKNGVPKVLTSSFSNFRKPIFFASSNPKSIFVDNNTVYIVGNATFSGKTYAAIWKNGTITKLSNIENTYAESIIVRNNNVHIVGYEKIKKGMSKEYTAKYWKNGTEKNLGPGKALSITLR